MSVARDFVQRIAGFELNALRAAEVLGEDYEKVRIRSGGTPIHDLNGTPLYHRLPLARGANVGYVDVAVHEAFGEPLLATAMGLDWNEKALVEEGKRAARKGRRGLKYDQIRFVAFSYPKIALQFLLDGQETLMLELGTWAAVPRAPKRDRKALEPENFERWSFLDELPKEVHRARARSFKRRLDLWDAPRLRRIDPRLVALDTLRVRDFVLRLFDTRELHYSHAHHRPPGPATSCAASRPTCGASRRASRWSSTSTATTYDQVRARRPSSASAPSASPNGSCPTRTGRATSSPCSRI